MKYNHKNIQTTTGACPSHIETKIRAVILEITTPLVIEPDFSNLEKMEKIAKTVRESLKT